MAGYRRWINATAALIKSLDANHLVTIGSEGRAAVASAGVDFSVDHAFPSIDLGVDDRTFCAKVIQDTGTIIVPGSGFGQKQGTEHFRVVFLPNEDILSRACDGIATIAAHATTVPHWSTQPTNLVGVPSSPPHTRNVMGTIVTAFRSGRWIHRIGDTRASLVVAS